MLQQHKVDRATVSREPSLIHSASSDELPSYVDIGPHDNDCPDPKVIFEQYTFAYIYAKVKCMVAHQGQFTPSNTQEMDLEDIAEEVYIHFWEILEDQGREPIRYPEAYLAKMIRHRLCDEMRKRVRHGNFQPISMVEGGMMQEGNAMISASSGMADPALEYERRQRDAQILHRYAYAVSKLPARQKLAMTCELLEVVDNLAWMADAFIIYGVETQVQWPEDKKAKQRLQANLSAARLSMAQCLHIDIATLPTRRHAQKRE